MIEFIKKNLSVTVVLLSCIGIILTITIYLIITWESKFYIDYASNLLATLLGVIIGIPIALGISQYQEKKTQEEKSKKKLDALYEELVENFGYLGKWKDGNMELKIKGTITLGALLKDDLWRAFCDGSEIQWIKNPNVLLSLSAGYSKIYSIKFLADKYYGLFHSESRKVDPATLEKIMGTLESTVNLAYSVLDSMIDWIGIMTEKPEYSTKGNLS